MVVKMLGEQVPASWLTTCTDLLAIDYNPEKFEAEGIVPVAKHKGPSLVTMIINNLVFWGISREDIPKGILPDTLWEELYEIRKLNPIFGDLGPICTNESHGPHDDGLKDRYLPRVVLAWAPPPEAEDPEADRRSPQP